MRTLRPVSQETYEKIGAAYVICAEYPEIFDNVTLKKFCSMFVDVIPDGENEQEARKREYGPTMYRLLQKAFMSIADAKIDEPLRLKIYECLSHITGDPCPTDEDIDEEARSSGSEHMAQIIAYAPEMYALLQAVFGGAISWTEVIRHGERAQELLARIDGKETEA